MKLKDTCSWNKSYDQPRQHIKKQRHYFANKSLSSQNYSFSSSHVWMWGLDYKESWVLKNWCFWTVVLEKTLESPLDKGFNQSILKELSPEYSLEVLMLKLKLQYFGHLMQRTDSFGKDPDAGWDWRQEEKGTTEDEMVDGITDLIGISLSKLWELVVDRDAPSSAVHGVTKTQTQLSDWTELNWTENTGVGCHALPQGIFPIQGSNWGLLCWRQILYHLSHQESPLPWLPCEK